MELKQIFANTEITRSNCSNCTFMELKPRMPLRGTQIKG